MPSPIHRTTSMPYAVLIYEIEQDVAERPGLMPAYAAYAQEIIDFNLLKIHG